MNENQWPKGEETFTSTATIAHDYGILFLAIVFGLICLIILIVYIFKKK